VRRAGALAAVVVVLLIPLDGCSNTGTQSCKEAHEGSASGEPCGVIRWHESHEGPTVYNNFHSTKE
jgi:hypothetical protein